MVILGIDPGSCNVGFGVVRKEGDRCRMIDYGMIVSSSEAPRAERLVQIHEAMSDLLRKHKPDAAVTEQLLFSVNRKSAMEVSQAIGVILLAIAEAGIRWQEYSPMQIKQSVVGYGGAEKKQVQFMVQRLLGLKEVPKPDHAADALAVCVTHAHTARWNALLEHR